MNSLTNVLRRAAAYVSEEILLIPRKPDIRYITRVAVIAALYAAVTLLLAPISYGALQFRVSEALTLLPILTPAGVLGLTVGCLIANLLGSATILDIVFGTVATLLAARLTRQLRDKPVLAALPPVVVNAIIVGAVLSYAFSLPLFLTIGQVGLGQLGACYVLGLPLFYALRRLPHNIW
jgi:uncharacterized membrane protein